MTSRHVEQTKLARFYYMCDTFDSVDFGMCRAFLWVHHCSTASWSAANIWATFGDGCRYLRDPTIIASNGEASHSHPARRVIPGTTAVPVIQQQIVK